MPPSCPGWLLHRKANASIACYPIPLHDRGCRDMVGSETVSSAALRTQVLVRSHHSLPRQKLHKRAGNGRTPRHPTERIFLIEAIHPATELPFPGILAVYPTTDPQVL